MNLFPDILKIRLIDSRTKKPVKHILGRIIIFARHKNNYSIESLSDNLGEIFFTRQQAMQEINMNKNLFLMDYSSDLDDCEDYVEIGRAHV